MTWRRIAIYYALCIVLGGYFFAFEWRPGGEKPILGAPRVQQSRFLPIARDDIQEIQLRTDGGSITFRRDGQSWEVTEPSGVQVTAALVTSLLENLTVEKEVQIVEESAGDLTPYGLAQPHSTIVLKGKDANPLATVFIGERNPTSSAVYARKDNSPQVVLLGYSVRYYEDLVFEAAGINKKNG